MPERVRTAVITGSSRNIGLGIATKLAYSGLNVVLNAKSSADELDQSVSTIRAMGGKAIGVLADVSSAKGVQGLAEAALGNFGTVDVLINNVGIRPRSEFLGLEYDEWRKVMSTNLDSAYLCSRAFMGGMVEQGWGRIINISGIDAFWGKPGKAHVATANLGLVGLARTLASEFGACGVTANSVVPGGIDTDRLKVGAWYPDWEEGSKAFTKRIPAGRFGRIDEVASIVAFLASEEASYVNGQTIHVNGGAFPTTRDPFEE